MPVDTSGADVALGQLSNLPFGQLIGAPLKAAIEAQAIAADTTINFIKEIGFTEDPTTGALSTTTVSFTFQAPFGATSILTVPVLAIIPIPFIEIETLDIAFKAKITASGSSSDTQSSTVTKAGNISASAGYRGRRFTANLAISGSVSSKRDSVSTRDSKYSVEYCYDLTLHAVQPGLPAGLSKVLGILESSCTPVPAGQLLLTVDATSATIKAADTKDIHFKLVNPDGTPADPLAASTLISVTPSTTNVDVSPVTTDPSSKLATVKLTGKTSGTSDISFSVASGYSLAPPPKIVTVTVP